MQFHPDTVQGLATTRLGLVHLAASPVGLCGLWFAGQRHLPAQLAHWPKAPPHPLLQRAEEQLLQYLDGVRSRFELPLDLAAGTTFQRTVWQALLGIARGHTCSYSALAQTVGRPAAVRAVGAAVGRNPLSVIVPCHRVLGSNGTLTGYAGGLERKIQLLRLESALPEEIEADS